ncbi:hypothetical protein [Paracraurococcus lichenis]|uniref:Uncharacterized protein n=1 Tax=Paracraurococcus lichenis TaxID=3064888 RepID=A0ABT9E7S4_9PROT|nr:hypothetical protein [Paracraurococcus sp. LOR1-02]MDO9712252.1 hypothetical protein [Paracraurococcus sp. LOR1-02]
MTRDQIEAVVAKERPGWRVVDFIEVNDESGPSFDATIEKEGQRVVLLIAEDESIAGERRQRRIGPCTPQTCRPAWLGVAGPKEEMPSLVPEKMFLAITGAPGFRGYYAFLGERNASRGVSASLFDTREHATEANQRVVSVMRDRRIAPSPPSVMAEQVVIVAAAGGLRLGLGLGRSARRIGVCRRSPTRFAARCGKMSDAGWRANAETGGPIEVPVEILFGCGRK